MGENYKALSKKWVFPENIWLVHIYCINNIYHCKSSLKGGEEKAMTVSMNNLIKNVFLYNILYMTNQVLLPMQHEEKKQKNNEIETKKKRCH